MHIRGTMSALAGVFGPGSASSPHVLEQMLGSMRNRAAGTPDIAEAPGARIGAARHDWEATLPEWSGPLVAEDDDWIVAADASLYYVRDLRRHLRLTSREMPSGELLLRALRTWGARFARYVEGDYAILAWEKRRGRLLLARDTGGRRTLVYATSGASTIVASTSGAVVCHPAVSREFDRGFIAASASFVFGPGQRTAYRHVSIVAPGSTLSIEGGTVHEIDRWTPVVGFDWEREPSQAAAEELRHLLMNATRERLDPERPTMVFMSGGWDSPSVFAAGCAALESAGVDRTKHPLLPVSMTYPPDDIGNEDHHINAIAARWDVPVTWLQTEKIPLLEDSENRALKHDDPMMQTFEGQMRHLARSSRQYGARVALDGFGGDHIFHVSSAAVIADHLFFGRFGELWQEWREWGLSGRAFLRLALMPLISDGVRDWLGTVRGRPLNGFWDRGFPPWIVRSREILAELAPAIERDAGESASQYELRRGLLGSITGRAASWNMAFGLDEGLQMRGPLFDRRVVSFAASRPLSDRAKAGDSKKLLRKAMAGLIPDTVLRARDRKTGTPSGYFKRQFQPVAEAEVRKLFLSGKSNLELLGVIDRQEFLRSVDRYVNSGAHLLGAAIQQTVAAERWLAVRTRLEPI